MANQAAADFFFWTGVSPSVELIRESFEEYLQW
jgi:shikimate 5-dehydrogenase